MGISVKILLIIFIASGLGGILRYAIQLFFKPYSLNFPTGTFIVNILGCLLIGAFYAFAEKNNMLSQEWRLALTTGFCGGFTTFSAFAYENMALLKTGNYTTFFLYTAGSVILGIFAVFAGIFAVKLL